jgi:hypothetical protein
MCCTNSRLQALRANHFIERTVSGMLRLPPTSAHVEPQASLHMTNHDPAWWLGFGFGAIAGGLMVGALLGLIPFVLGQAVGDFKLGRVGFLCTVVAALVGGIFLAVPTVLGFVVAIAFRRRRTQQATPPVSNNDA